ncbi:conserved hypothetical protein [Hyphomicrobiales bacterium]|jgi:hypothetical protein|nr:conserved hypothetical protein [Hyphomicrobiales bacterium]CAH1702562.1 hypothetical protein BOSEA1005_30434 [Hyphomicrobiales bacterium]CAI0346765.1 conserved hypothetical protein [Hyphomicrobiales bacterium]
MRQVWKAPDQKIDGQTRCRGINEHENLRVMLNDADKAIEALVGGPDEIYADRLALTIVDCENSLFGEKRNADRYLADYRRHADTVVMKVREIDRLPSRRLLATAELSSRGNLTVLLTPQAVGRDGELTRAREWKKSLFDGIGGRYHREPNELLFIRNAGMLFASNSLDGKSFGFDGLSEAGKNAFRLVADLVNTAYWHRMNGLEHFDMAVDMHIALLRDEKHTALGLEMIDDLAEHRIHLVSRVDRLEEQTGYSADVFLEAMRVAASEQVSGKRHAKDDLHSKLSRELRTKTGVGSDLTPGAVREILDLLNTAIAYRICRMPKAPVELATVAAPTSTPVPPEAKQLPDRPLADPDRTRFRQRPEIFRAPPYGQLRGAEWPEHLSPEFGVNSTHAFVEKLNELRQYEGRLPVPQGSYPSSPRMLSAFVKEARTIVRRQNEMRPGM